MKHKKPILIAAISLLSVAAVIGGIFAFLRLNREPVLVIPVSEVSTAGDIWTQSPLYGVVTADRIQAVFLSETQTVTGLCVSEGDAVSAGDPLLTYDTSLTDLQLQRKELEIKKQERDLELAQKEYKSLFGKSFILPEPTASTRTDCSALSSPAQGGVVLRLLTETETELLPTEETLPTEKEPLPTELTEPTPTEPIPTQPVPTESETEVPTEPADEMLVTTWKLLGGNGTEETPYLYVVADDYSMEPGFLQSVLGNRETAQVVFAQCADNRADGIVQSAWGMLLEKAETGKLTFRLTDASEYVGTQLIGTQTDDPSYDPGFTPGGGGGMSYAELQKLRVEKEQAMTEMDISLRMARVEYKRMQSELGDGTVYADIDGVVLSVGDPETAFLNGEAVVKVSGGGGYCIEGTASELLLDEIMIGRAVTVTSWNNGMSYDGVITAVSNLPTASDGWVDGNNNVSFYPFTVTVDEAAELMDGEYLEMQLAGEGTESSFCVEKPFILQENGKSYVYVADENGRLQKREIQTGRDLWGSYYEVFGGITPEDMIAFPYGKNVTDGAKTKQGTVSDLNGW